MPLYEYICPKCEIEFELMRPMSEVDKPALCPQCGSPGQKLVSVFGSPSGFYLKVPLKSAFRKSSKGEENQTSA